MIQFKRALQVVFILFLSVQFSFGKSFTTLSSDNYFAVQNSAKSNGAMNIKLIVQSENNDKPNIPIELKIIINSDTIWEYHSLPHLYSGAIKSIPVETGDRVWVGIKLYQPGENIQLENMKGDLFLIPKSLEEKVKDGKIELSTGVWPTESTQIIKIDLKKDTVQSLVLEIETTPQFIQDSLHVQISFMLPNRSFGSERISFIVQNDSAVVFKSRTLSKRIEAFFKPSGSYVFQVVVLNEGGYVNGIRSLEIKNE